MDQEALERLFLRIVYFMDKIQNKVHEIPLNPFCPETLWKYFTQDFLTYSSIYIRFNLKYQTYIQPSGRNQQIWCTDDGRKPILSKYGLHNVHQLLRSIGNPNLPFGGEVVDRRGDRCQCRCNSEQTEVKYYASIQRIGLWKHSSWNDSMPFDPDQRGFAKYLWKHRSMELSKTLWVK